MVKYLPLLKKEKKSFRSSAWQCLSFSCSDQATPLLCSWSHCPPLVPQQWQCGSVFQRAALSSQSWFVAAAMPADPFTPATMPALPFTPAAMLALSFTPALLYWGTHCSTVSQLAWLCPHSSSAHPLRAQTAVPPHRPSVGLESSVTFTLHAELLDPQRPEPEPSSNPVSLPHLHFHPAPAALPAWWVCIKPSTIGPLPAAILLSRYFFICFPSLWQTHSKTSHWRPPSPHPQSTAPQCPSPSLKRLTYPT